MSLPKDEFDALQAIAADNARMCEIVIACDKIVEYVERVGLVKYAGHRKLEALLDAYKVVRNGQ